MIGSFADKDLENFFLNEKVPRGVAWTNVQKIVRRKLFALDAAHKISDLKHLNIDSDYSEEKLTAMIEQLRLVYNDITPVEVTEKFTKRKPIPANKGIKKKAAKK